MARTGRFLAGGACALFFMGAGLFWWQSHAQGDELIIPAAPPPVVVRAQELPVAAPGQIGKPPPMPASATAQTREQKRFDRYDSNRDGIITRTEMLSSRTKAFRKLDTDGNNLLSFEEWAVTTSDRFASADGDANGKLTPPEFATTAPKRRTKPKCKC
ncbi:EF-hand domain-containing protein [Rhizorhapis sp. SPR117]|uniref:EF-hand domain-containing protein n=1 Tax=Rhizorhapis sp. SPR117 TaxID=2912611 RepID=UPI001F3D48D1|nr:EF-hand domain-containing protein [Rhizorhapis sp. SPR117]